LKKSINAAQIFALLLKQKAALVSTRKSIVSIEIFQHSVKHNFE